VYSIVTSDMPFVGRTAELARLRSAFEAVCRGETAVVHIVGASGIGKSELVRRFLASIETAGDVLVLRGRCHPQEAVPYKAVDRVVDALSRVLLACQDAGLPVPVPEQGSALTRLFPVLERVPAFAQLPKLYDAVEPPCASYWGKWPASVPWSCGSTIYSGETSTAPYCCASYCARPVLPRCCCFSRIGVKIEPRFRCPTPTGRSTNRHAT
jgi:hypothetical protein